MLIQINPEEIRDKGNQFSSKSEELNSLIAASRRVMDDLHSTFRGQRANAIFNEWEGMQSRLQNAVETLRNTGALLKQAATDFSEVDSR